eukprot:6204895-Pleurochrysis_carterae.AAC.3
MLYTNQRLALLAPFRSAAVLPDVRGVCVPFQYSPWEYVRSGAMRSAVPRAPRTRRRWADSGPELHACG